RHTSAGAVRPRRPGATDTALVTLLRLTGQTFSRVNDLTATWNYHEITPSNALKGGDAGWIQGKIDLHPDGCNVATLFLDGGGPARDVLQLAALRPGRRVRRPHHA